MATRIKLRRDTNANWTANDPILSEGEIGIVTDAASDDVKVKIGDGATAWNSLSYFVPGSSEAVWGSISGTLSDQTDLQNELDAKLDLSGGIITGPLTINAATEINGSLTVNGTVDLIVDEGEISLYDVGINLIHNASINLQIVNDSVFVSDGTNTFISGTGTVGISSGVVGITGDTQVDIEGAAINLKGSVSFLDYTDDSKVLTHDVSGITTGTTRTATWQDKDITVAGTEDIPSDTDELTEGEDNLYFTQNRAVDAQVLGNIVYNEFLTSSELDDYTNEGTATFALNGSGGLDVSGGSSDFSNYFHNSWRTILNKWTFEVEFENVTDGDGIAFGTNQLYCLIDTNTAGDRGHYYIYGGSTPSLLASSSTPVSFTNGDTLKVVFTRHDNYVTLQLINVTTDTIYDTISYTQTLGVSVSNGLQNNPGYPTIYAYGGAQTVTKFAYKSHLRKRPDILVMGDSNAEGWGQAYDPVTSSTQGSVNTTFAYRLQSMCKLTVEKQARGGSDTQALIDCLDETLLINPRIAVIMIGTNDAISSVVQGTYASRLDTIITTLVENGITPVICKVLPHATGATNTLITSYNSGIDSDYSGKFVIVDTSSANMNSTSDLADGVHLNMPGADKVARLIANAISSVGLAPTRSLGSNFNYFNGFASAAAGARNRLFINVKNNGGSNMGPVLSGRLQTITAGSELSVLEIYGYNGSPTLTHFFNFWGPKLGINNGVGSAPSAAIHVKENTIGSEVCRFETVATNDDPYFAVVQGRNTTTDATVTTLRQLALTASQTYYIKAVVVARRTGGSSGTAEDGAAYKLEGVFKTVAGSATQIGSTTKTVIGEDQAGWDADFDTSGANVRVRVTGAADNNITWHLSKLEYSSVGS